MFRFTITPEDARKSLEAGKALFDSGRPLTNEERDWLKSLAFGAVYGRSAAVLARDAPFEGVSQ